MGPWQVKYNDGLVQYFGCTSWAVDPAYQYNEHFEFNADFFSF